jgi:uncharacterized damage-inducible protein DinB
MPTTSEMIDAYLAGAQQLRQAVAGLTREQLLARPVAGKWSTLEVVAHLADFEPVFVDRMKRIIALSSPLLLVADENDFAKHLAYHDRDLNEELTLIEATRTSMARILRTLPAAAWTKTGVHSVKGLLALEAVLQGAINHILHHLPFIAEKRKALGA